MRTLKKIVPVIMGMFLLGTVSSFAQKGHKHGHGHGHKHGHKHPAHNKVVVVKRSPFRPAKVVVYHPVWGPKHAIHRRWVYFPKYNIYWDNWRNHYVFWNGTIWFSQPAPPPVIININLENEKHVTLKEDEDDVDDVYKGNEEHKKQKSE